MDRLLIAPSTSPISIALVVPSAWEDVPIDIPLDKGSFILKSFKINGAAIAPVIPVITIAITVIDSIPPSVFDISIPIGVVTDLGASDFISRPFNVNIVQKRVSNIISLYSKQRRLKDIVTEQIYEKESRSNLMISVLSHIVEFRNGESGLHIIHINMITEKLQKEINDQITAEMWSSNLYLSMAFHMEKEGFAGMASWLKKQALEEQGHACEMASYVIKRGGVAKLDKIDVVPTEFGTPLAVFEQVYEHECRVSKMIDDLVDIASAERDKATQDFLWGFVREQVEEEATAAGIVDMVKKAGNAGVYYVDAKLGERK